MEFPTNAFKQTIKEHLEYRGFTEPLFKKKLENPKKNLDDCVTYILNQVQKMNCNGFTDDEIFNMAVHYYDEEKIEVGKPINARVVVNHQVKLSEKEITEAKQKALDEVIEAEKKRLTEKKKPKKEASTNKEDAETTGGLF